MIDRINAAAARIEAAALKDLETIVNLNSFTSNPAGLKEVGRVLMEMAGRLGFDLVPVPLAGEGTKPFHLLGDWTDGNGRPFYGLLGHFDTVHLPESPFNRLAEQEGKLIGPGVQDMKAGLIAALYSLVVAREATGLGTLPVKIIFNCDEETGSLDSRPLIEREMAGAAGAFIFEPRYDYDHALVTARKGILMGWLEVEGRAAHAGEAPEQGANAVVEAAHKTIALEGLNDLKAGTTVTVGKVAGGKAANQIPDSCRAEIDVRFKDPETGKKVETEIRRILEETTVPGTSSRYELVEARPPMVCSAETALLRDRYFEAAARMGVPWGERSSGGGSDANLTAALGVPTLDGLGPEGDGPHTDHEYVVKESVLDSIRVSALFLSGLIK